MWPFGKRVSDQEWLDQIRPLCESVTEVTAGLAEAIRDEDLETTVAVVSRIEVELPTLVSAVKDVPAPTSSGARDARGALRKACRYYLDGVKAGRLFLQGVVSDLEAMGPSDELSSGVGGRLRAGRFAYQKGFFEELMKVAEASKDQATAYILGSRQR